MTIDERIQVINERHEKMLRAVVEFPSIEVLTPYVKDQLANLDRHGKISKILVLYYGGTIGMEYHDLEGMMKEWSSKSGSSPEAVFNGLHIERDLYDRGQEVEGRAAILGFGARETIEKRREEWAKILQFAQEKIIAEVKRTGKETSEYYPFPSWIYSIAPKPK